MSSSKGHSREGGNQEEPLEFKDTLSQQNQELLTKLADKIINLRMTTPAILFLESVRPMNYIGSQVMVFFAPMVRIFFDMPEWNQLSGILEQRESIAYFLDLIEQREGDYLLEMKRKKEERKALKKQAKMAAKDKK